MMKFFASLIFIISNYNAQCQKNSRIELSPFFRLDWYPKFAYCYQGRASTDSLKMSGQCFGIDANYRLPISKNYGLIAGLGYNILSFSNLTNKNSQFGESKGRPIKVPSFNNLGYYTDRYTYHNISIAVGINRWHKINHSFSLNTGITFKNWFTFSQNYHLTYQDVSVFKNKKITTIAQSADINISMLKQYNKFQIGPRLILPVFTHLKKDDVFRETNGGFTSKWFSGLGLGGCIIF